MSRAAPAATAALALVVALLSVAALPGPGGRAAASDCTWQRHSKRAVQHLKRQGRVRRQVRVKHWWTCVPPAPTAAAAPPPSPQPAPDPPAPTPPTPPKAEIGRLSVTSRDSEEPWSLTLSRPSLKAGEVIVELNNLYGGDAHNLNLEREGAGEAPLAISEAGPAEHRSGRFTLAAGTYRLWCSLPEHEEKGMSTSLVVEPG